MAKKPDYHGFDQYKNIVEAPKIYMSAEEIEATALVGQQAIANAQGEKSIVVMQGAGVDYPGNVAASGLLLSMRSVSSQTFQLYYSPNANDVYVCGQYGSPKDLQYNSWKKLLDEQDLSTINSSITTLRSEISSSDKVVLAELPWADSSAEADRVSAPDNIFMENGKLTLKAAKMGKSAIGELPAGERVVQIGGRPGNSSFGVSFLVDTGTGYMYYRSISPQDGGKGYYRVATTSYVDSQVNSKMTSLDKVSLAELPYQQASWDSYVKSPDIVFMENGKITIKGGRMGVTVGDLPADVEVVQIGGRPEGSSFGISIAAIPRDNRIFFRALAPDGSNGYTELASRAYVNSEIASKIGGGSSGGITYEQAKAAAEEVIKNKGYVQQASLDTVQASASMANRKADDARSKASTADTHAQEAKNLVQNVTTVPVCHNLYSTDFSVTVPANGGTNVHIQNSAIASGHYPLMKFNSQTHMVIYVGGVVRQGEAYLYFRNLGETQATVAGNVMFISAYNG